jgi:light-harvesting protein B-800-850 alpha chain
MNQGRIWCVVNPTVGLPLFLGSVAVTSLIVHYSVLSNTSWFSSYWNGKAKVKAASVEPTPSVAMNSANGAPGLVISVAPVAGNGANAETSYVITVAPKPVATAQAETSADATAARLPDALALAAPGTK